MKTASPSRHRATPPRSAPAKAPKHPGRPDRAAAASKRPRKARAPTPMLAKFVRCTTHTQPPMRAVTGYVIEADLPVRTKSEMNVRGNRWTLTKRKQEHRSVVSTVLAGAIQQMLPWLDGPLRITLTRVGPARIDCDSSCISQKYLRDQIAYFLDIDDGDDRIVWVYRRELAKSYGVRVAIRSGSAIAAEIDAEHSRAMAWFHEASGSTTAARAMSAAGG